MKRAGIFLVPGEGDDDPRPVEGTDALERLERVKDDDVPALHVRASSARSQRVEPEEPFAFTLEDGIEVSDDQKPFPPRALPLGEQMTRPADRIGQRYPIRLESERGKLGLKEPTHRAYAGDVERSAADVDRFLQECDLFRLVGTDVVPDLLFRGRQSRGATRLSER